ncbi:MAG: HDOD domain-containing protein [Nitrospinota bacterium]
MIPDVQLIIDSAEIPSVPDVLQDILTLSKDPQASSRQLEQLIRKEPGLVAYLLKTVNSSYYGFPKKISSLNQTIVMLGFSSVQSIASGLMLIDTFNNLPGLNKKYVLTIWDHSLFCAGLIRIIGKKMDAKKQEEMFLASMVHNVGHLVLSQYFGPAYDQLIEQTPFPPPENEMELLNVDHTEAGSSLLEKWKFSPDIISSVATHHNSKSYIGEKQDLYHLQTCDLLARLFDGDFLDSETCSSEDLSKLLEDIGWTWEDLRKQKEQIQTVKEGVSQTVSL